MTLPKNQYRFSLFYPSPETTNNHALGESELLWGMARTIPSVGEDPVYVIWRWLDCCNT
ncbi:TraU family protein [Acinetobacter baumannii]|nr:TraU family protein [Acinetobacter baumannii]